MSIWTVALPGLEILGRPLDGVRPDGVYFGPDGLDGWDDGVEMRRETVQRLAAAGDFDATGYPDSRVVTLSGVIVSPSEDRTRYWMERLTGVLNNGGQGRVTVTRGDTTRFASAGLVRSKTTPRTHRPWQADWQMQLWCPDPRKYGALNTVSVAGGEAARVNHFGNAEASPVIVLSGDDSNGYTIAGPSGRTIGVTIPLASGRPHSIDFATGQLSIGGVVQYGALASADFFTIWPGRTTEITMTNTSTSSRMTVNTFDTYL